MENIQDERLNSIINNLNETECGGGLYTQVAEYSELSQPERILNVWHELLDIADLYASGAGKCPVSDGLVALADEIVRIFPFNEWNSKNCSKVDYLDGLPDSNGKQIIRLIKDGLRPNPHLNHNAKKLLSF